MQVHVHINALCATHDCKRAARASCVKKNVKKCSRNESTFYTFGKQLNRRPSINCKFSSNFLKVLLAVWNWTDQQSIFMISVAPLIVRILIFDWFTVSRLSLDLSVPNVHRIVYQVYRSTYAYLLKNLLEILSF